MKNAAILAMLVLLGASAKTIAVSKTYSGKPILTNKMVDGIQYIRKGEPYLDLSKAPIVATFDEADNSITLTSPRAGAPDSLYYRFIPGDLISVRLSADVAWDVDTHVYRYDYAVKSLPASKTPIEELAIDEQFEFLGMGSPKGWIGFFNRDLKRYLWTHYAELDSIVSGDSISGFSFISSGPPTLGRFFVASKIRLIDFKAEDDIFADAYFKIVDSHKGVEGTTLVPSPRPEKIEATEWVMEILSNFGDLRRNGYIPEEDYSDLREIMRDLNRQLRSLESPTSEVWSPLVDSTLIDLTQYQSLIQPEAYSYITENIKYMQRNKDIVWFGKYVPPPEQRQE
jgi:hypothetical protein